MFLFTCVDTTDDLLCQHTRTITPLCEPCHLKKKETGFIFYDTRCGGGRGFVDAKEEEERRANVP